MAKTLTPSRRAVLATALAAPLAPGAGETALAATPEPDPALAAYERWIAAHVALEAHLDTTGGYEDHPDYPALDRAETDATRAMAEAIPTTPRGVLCKLILFGRTQGGADTSRDVMDPSTFYTEPRRSLEAECWHTLLRGLMAMEGAA